MTAETAGRPEQDRSEPDRSEPDRPEPASLDTSVAHPARVYDYWLGGKDNFAADREAAEAAIADNPFIVPGVRTNREFLGRAVRYLAGEAEIRQFLDIGTGIPTADNTHEVAQAAAPEARIVYVDNDHRNSGCAHVESTRACGVTHAARQHTAPEVALRSAQ